MRAVFEITWDDELGKEWVPAAWLEDIIISNEPWTKGLFKVEQISPVQQAVDTEQRARNNRQYRQIQREIESGKRPDGY